MSDFKTNQFAGSLPGVLILHQDYPPILRGAVSPGFDPTTTITDNRIPLQQVFYTTPDHIHGLLHYESPSQLFFMGYKCGQCEEVFLVPDSVHDETELAQAMRHGCTNASI
jgi:hypothetical protein